MKRKFFYAALLATLGLAATSCQKENITESGRIATEMCAEKTLHYTIGGMHFSQTVNNEEEYDALLMRLIALSREGYDVNIFGNNYTYGAVASKEVITYTTQSESDAVAWTKQKIHEGYSVSVTFNEETGYYTCIATK